MADSVRRRAAAVAVFASLLAVTASAALAFQARPRTSRFDALVVEDPTRSLDVSTTPETALAPGESARGAWSRFRAAHGPAWSVYLDRRSGAPLLVEGRGIPWSIAKGATAETIASSLRAFIGGARSQLLADNAELVFDREASGRLSPDVWQIVFDRSIAGVPVTGERYVFTLGHGRLISFGAPRWSRIDASPFPDIDASEALVRLTAYMGLKSGDGVTLTQKGNLELVPLRADGGAGARAGRYAGPIGSGYASALVWRLALRVDGEPGTWEALVDAHTGAIRSFRDINDYAQVTGGVYPVSNDQLPTDGVEQPGYPMPYADVTIGDDTQFAGSSGGFTCDPGGATATTTLAGRYVKVVDTCGPVSESIFCDNDLDLGASAGTDCEVPDGSAGGNTHASRTGFYHLNRIVEHARVWLPSRAWLSGQLTDNVNLNQTCNAYWNGTSVNFFKSGGGCRNTGEIAGIFLHEWGHGLDANDGGGMDNPSEAYADVTAMMSTHVSCVGRGFDMANNCSGYGDVCLDCTGIRDQDYAKHASNTPATPAGFLTGFCPIGGGPCGREVHCESHVGAEALWDLAVRDLPAAGLDLASSWQLADKLWYRSRLGSGGNAYNCALPDSDGCSATSWFSKLRTIDDDDGDLANGTPHAAAIFAAFDRHKIACGAAGDASNQNSSSCPALGAAVLAATAGSSSARLDWTPVANAVAYNVLRNDASCAAGSTIVATVPGTTFTDTGLANGFTEFYTVQAVGANAACDGLLSNCQAVVPRPFIGSVKLDAVLYGCSSVIQVTVIDANVGGPTTTVEIASGAEPAGETITLTEAAPGSAIYAGTIAATGSAAAADGLLSVADGDTVTATYVDADDGQGGVDLPRAVEASVDCVVPVISNVASSDVTGNSATITWDTNEASSSVVHFGLTPPPGSSAGASARVVGHAVDLTGLSECSSYLYGVESADAVGNTAADDNAGQYYAFVTGVNVRPTYPYTGAPVPIPDNNPTGATATIVVPDNKIIQDLNVTIGSLTHTFDGDIAIHLIGPDATDVVLSNKRGYSGDDYTNTVFDDQAATPIASGTAPFTGAFVPDSPLSVFEGKSAAGTWTLRVVDNVAVDSGVLNAFSLDMTFPAQACDTPHAIVASATSIAQICPTGGPGASDSVWDAGERVRFKINVKADGTAPLTNVSATIVPTTPGVTMIDGTATFPNLGVGVAADSNAPHFTAKLPASLPCGSTVDFQVTIDSAEGSWVDAFSHEIGRVSAVSGTALSEDFAAGLPATWTVIDGGVGGNPGATTWTTANPGGRTAAAPMAAPFAIVDSDNAGPDPTTTQDEQLFTPPIDLSTASTASVAFDQYFRWFADNLSEIADVDVRSTLTGGAWVNVLRQQGAASPNPDHKVIDITAQAAGAPDAQVRFHYYQAHYEWWWQVDNVAVAYTEAPTCHQNVCADAPAAARPVADGSFGTAMTASRGDAPGSTINLTWDVWTCSSTDHHVLYGPLAGVSTATVGGAACDLGASGSASWIGVPAGDLWFVVVGDDDATTEGSWGTATSGERGGAAVSGQCGLSTRDNAGTCP